ncbi:MAG TPA: DUF418 domain-containing protein [Vicinamibacterales bacterium]|nr:DUF418 domain-containing protein [Vicinamibacterales bacterium]
MGSTATPIGHHDRYEAIDLLRGLAVLGILVMNIQSFAMPMAAYFNPTALGDRGPVDFYVWAFSHLFFDQKFMTLFSWLFGAGIILMTARAAERGVKPAAFHYRRMLGLLVFGLIHAYLIWDGDILVLYAICGAIVYPFRKLRPMVLLALGLLSLAIGSSLMIGGGFYIPRGPAGAIKEFQDFWAPSAEQLQRETLAFQGGWLAQMPMRAKHSLEFQLSDIWLWGVWRAGGNMLIGMALLKWRVVTAELQQNFYRDLAVIGFGFGLPLIAGGVASMSLHDWETFHSFFIAGQFNYWASLLVAAGWMGFTIAMWHAGIARGLAARLIAVGRTAFSCYILTSLMCTFIFYGHGLGYFGRVSRPGQVAVTVAVWMTLLIAAPLWLARFRFGPLEWLWRTLTYGERQPLRRARHSASDWPQISTDAS